MVEVVVDLRRRLDEPQSQAFAHVEVGLALARPLDLGAVEILERVVETRDSQRHVLERAGLTRPLCAEQRQLAAPRIRSDQRERVGSVDDVHADATRKEVGDRVPVGHPEGDVVEGLGRHCGRIASHYFLPVDRALELLLGHLRATLDVQLLGLVVELLLGAPARPVRAGAQTAAAARRDVLARRAATTPSPRRCAPAPC